MPNISAAATPSAAVAAEPIAEHQVREHEEASIAPALQEIQLADLSPGLLRGSTAAVAGPSFSPRMGLNPRSISLGPALPEPLP